MNERLASEIATTLRHAKPITTDILNNANVKEEAFPNRQVTAWFKGKWYVLQQTEDKVLLQAPPTPVSLPPEGKSDFANLAIDGNHTALRSARELQVGGDKLIVVSSVPLDVSLMGKVAEKIGVVQMEAFTKTQDDTKGVKEKGPKLKIWGRMRN